MCVVWTSSLSLKRRACSGFVSSLLRSEAKERQEWEINQKLSVVQYQKQNQTQFHHQRILKKGGDLVRRLIWLQGFFLPEQCCLSFTLSSKNESLFFFFAFKTTSGFCWLVKTLSAGLWLGSRHSVLGHMDWLTKVTWTTYPIRGTVSNTISHVPNVSWDHCMLFFFFW